MLPVEALEEWVLRHCQPPSSPYVAGNERRQGGRPSARRLGELVGFTGRSVVRWRAGGVPPYSADRCAIALGTHPATIWPEWVEATEAAA